MASTWRRILCDGTHAKATSAEEKLKWSVATKIQFDRTVALLLKFIQKVTHFGIWFIRSTILPTVHYCYTVMQTPPIQDFPRSGREGQRKSEGGLLSWCTLHEDEGTVYQRDLCISFCISDVYCVQDHMCRTPYIRWRYLKTFFNESGNLKTCVGLYTCMQ